MSPQKRALTQELQQQWLQEESRQDAEGLSPEEIS